MCDGHHPNETGTLLRAPLERLELSLSAPEADALSAELQGRAREFYHAAIATHRPPCCSLRTMGESGHSGSEVRQLAPQRVDEGSIPLLVAELEQLLLLVCQLAAQSIELCSRFSAR